MPQPIRYNAQNIDLSPRFSGSSTVVASPAAAAETIIASVTLAGFNDLAVIAGIRLQGWCSFTAGTNGVTATLRLRQTNVTGAIVAATGANTVVATNVYSLDVLGADAAPGVAVYVLTLQVGSGSASSTVSATHISASIF